MGLREWLMILGGVVLTLIIADGIRRMRKSDATQDDLDEEERARQAQLRRELPAGKARVIKTHDVDVFDDDPIPVLCHEIEIPGFKDSDPSQSSRYSNSEEDLASFNFNNEEQQESQDQLSPFATENTQEEPRATVQDLNDSDAYSSPLPEADFVNNDEASLGYEDALLSEPFATAEYETELESEPQLEFNPEEGIPLNGLDDLEPPVPLEQRFAEEQYRRQEALRLRQEEADAERQATADEQAEALAQQEEDEDPVKAAARRILGKHTGPRPSERLAAMQQQMSEVSLAEQQYLDQQAAESKAQVARLKDDQARKANAGQIAQGYQSQSYQSQPYQGNEEPADSYSSQEEVQPPMRERPTTRKPLLTEEEERGQIADANELLVMHVKCRDPRGFHGSALLHIVMQCGMQFGDMKVFHRFVKTEDGPQIQFSMLSSVEPGVFDLDEIDELYIPSITFIMGLPAPGNSQECFSMMLETAKVIVRHLDGELRDEHRSVMTPQTIEHYKQRIQDFERRKQLARMR
ncbi:cell division protein ZipA [Oceanospirillum maris]|uniref:cell division protein ZipA n=1 Tax=Oceanospirillum maris TaxID=64977 RepID=UPI00040CAE97|nr:cell division protein ZipA [Oceanospirillum maris]